MKTSDKIGKVLIRCVVQSLMGGLSYEEGIVMFRAGALLMEQIDETPNADNKALEKLALSFIEAELAK